MESQHWVLIETGGNQRYVFSSNRLRHVVGASQLVHEVGTTWVPDAVRELGQPDDTVVMTASGKALLLVDSAEAGRAVIRAVTGRALDEAPGLRVIGAVGEALDPRNPEDALRETHARHSLARAARPDPLTRDRVFPWHLLCRDSGQPAAGEERYGDEPPVPASAGILARSSARERAAQRLRRELGDLCQVLPPHLDELVHNGWVAVAHADGNGVGGLFQSFGEHVAAVTGGGRAQLETYRRYQREVARELDTATWDAVRDAVRTLVDEHGHRVDGRFLPIVVGGDDVTVVCDAALASRFVRGFAAAFERHTAATRTLSKIAERATGRAGLTASAGIAFVKSHHPFANAYDLAEALTRSAKRFRDAGGRTLAAVDFHLVHASTRQELEALREYLPAPGGEPIARYAGPYLLAAGPPAELRDRGTGPLDEIMKWLGPEGWLSGAQAHALREAADRSLDEYRRQLELTLRHAPDEERARARELLSAPEPGPPGGFLRLFDALCLRGLRLDSATEGGAS